jgi:hypothetical protein
VQYYESRNRQPVDVTVSLVKVNPRAEVAYYGTVKLPVKGAERTALRFTVTPDGGISDINTIPKTLVQTNE